MSQEIEERMREWAAEECSSQHSVDAVATAAVAVAGFEQAAAIRELAAAIRELTDTGNASEPSALYIGNALRDIAAALADRGER